MEFYKNKDFKLKTNDPVNLIRSIYGEGMILLHRPIFEGNERQYLNDCIDSNFVSSVGPKVSEFEQLIAKFTGARYAIATMNGTSSLHISLYLAGVNKNEEVITQALTFIATCNAINYVGAIPVFIDVDRDTMGMSPDSLRTFLMNHTERRGDDIWNKTSNRRIAACVPMHTFGLPCRIEEIAQICNEWGLSLVEDSAESLGSYANGRHTGTFGLCGVISFNGNKIITTGGGGIIITNNEALAKRAKHITTTAKIPHSFEFIHDEIGFNYRLPNLNAALGCAQMEKLEWMLKVKDDVSLKYKEFCIKYSVSMALPLHKDKANNWLNSIILKNKDERDAFLTYTNQIGIMTRPIWRLMSELEMFKHCQHDGLINSHWLADRVVNIPSSVPERIEALI